MADKKDIKHKLRYPSTRLRRQTKSGRLTKTLKMFCRCGQKVRITFPTPKDTGKCPACGHKFKLPKYEED